MPIASELTVSPDTDPYGRVAGLYDLLHIGRGSPDLVRFFADQAPRGGRALEIGPGTGRMTLAVGDRVAQLYCLERSAAMRVVLLTKLAARPDLRRKVTVLDSATPEVPFDEPFDYVYLAAVLEHVPHDARRAFLAGLARHLKPTGRLVTDMVHDEAVPDQPERHVREARLGECRYTLSSAARPFGTDLALVRHVYRTWYGGEMVATETVERRHFLHRPADVIADLAAVGLTAVGGSAVTGPGTPLADKGTLVAHLTDGG